jgi:hypothetical protein
MERIDITLKLTLPKTLISAAESAGLLTEAGIEHWLTEELTRRQKLDRFFNHLDHLAGLEPRLTEVEIAAEVESYRVEKHHHKPDQSV